MSEFFIGQRVRVVQCTHPEMLHYRGVETMIVGVAFGEWQLSLKPPRQPGVVTAPSDCLEPIIPDGLESLDRINELYEPEPEVIRI